MTEVDEDHVVDQQAVARDTRVPLVAISQLAGDVDAPVVASMHVLQGGGIANDIGRYRRQVGRTGGRREGTLHRLFEDVALGIGR